MDFETSFDEYNASNVASKFIALEISDKEDDYDSSVHSMPVSEMEIGNVMDPCATQTSSEDPSVVQLMRVSTQTNASANVETRPKSEDKKKWSFVSVNSSSKKRWSALSFASDIHSKASKRMSAASSSSSAQSTSAPRSSSSMVKRSSTGASLRSLLNKITHTDSTSGEAGNSANSATSTKPGLALSSASVFSPSRTDIMSYIGRKPTINANSFRMPLKTISSNMNRIIRPTTHSTIDETQSTKEDSYSPLTPSRWKFWKSNRAKEDEVDAINIWPNNQPVPLPHMTHTRSKTSLTDLRKSIFSSNNLNDGNRSASTIKHRLSHHSLRKMASQSSLKTMASHSSLKKLRRGSADDSPAISLPIPDQASRDKIRIKLKNSASLISINNGEVSGTPIITDSNEYNKAILNQLLDLCDTKCIQDYDCLPVDMQKISTNYVYLNPSDDTIYKILPFSAGDDTLIGKDTLLKELQLQRLISGTPGFIQLLNCGVYKKQEDESIYLVLHMKNHGSPLSETKDFTFPQLQDILAQCFRALYVAESKFQFEHRYLTTEHILLDKQGNITICDYRLSRASHAENCWFTRLDNPLFFQGPKDYNYVLQWMRSTMNSHTWHLHHPRTNLYWLHYIANWLLTTCKEISPERPKLEKLYASLDPTQKRKRWNRSDSILENCGDLLCQR
ncbi:HER226Cp [Eremothecium sinecaudum]|uniref:non-specific serine/threonine protein kinase n=1 Tax=Eremothecium sinecaudum TaxID=45286 RepID=A0A0X8HU61_9SACH|nr:HER226Cp [Eremothecium sinecaudum]AMD21504.1 HER226Cp [Eremothecium sinecaudum]